MPAQGRKLKIQIYTGVHKSPHSLKLSKTPLDKSSDSHPGLL